MPQHVEPGRLSGERVDLHDQEVGAPVLDHAHREGAAARLAHDFDPDAPEDDFDRLQPDRVRIQYNRLQCRRGGSHAIAADRIYEI